MCGDTFEYGGPSMLPNTVGVRENSELVPNMAPLITCVGLQFSTTTTTSKSASAEPEEAGDDAQVFLTLSSTRGAKAGRARVRV